MLLCTASVVVMLTRVKSTKSGTVYGVSSWREVISGVSSSSDDADDCDDADDGTDVAPFAGDVLEVEGLPPQAARERVIAAASMSAKVFFILVQPPVDRFCVLPGFSAWSAAVLRLDWLVPSGADR